MKIHINFVVFFTNNNKIAKACKIFVFSLLENKDQNVLVILYYVYDSCQNVVAKHLITY